MWRLEDIPIKAISTRAVVRWLVFYIRDTDFQVEMRNPTVISFFLFVPLFAWYNEAVLFLKINLELESLWLFPGELGTTEVTVCRGLFVYGLEQVQLLNNDSWS